MFKDLDVDSVVKNAFDGATILGSKYVPPSVPDYQGEVEEDQKVYPGNCHCGAVTYALKTKPLEELKVISCNCSLCSRVGLFPPCYFIIFPNNNLRKAIYSSTLLLALYRSMARKT